ncbi:hypothetical protein Bca4012_064571 [Brassica carinata]
MVCIQSHPFNNYLLSNRSRASPSTYLCFISFGRVAKALVFKKIRLWVLGSRASFRVLGWKDGSFTHEPTWRKAGIFEAIKVSTYNITKNPSLLLSVSQNWYPETNSFVFPWGEATITLEDVMVLLGFSVLGSPVLSLSLESSEMKDAVEKLEKAWKEEKTGHDFVRGEPWTLRFFGRGDLEHEAFLVLWLSLYVFPERDRRSISKHVVPIAVRLARVQVWTWERFKNLRPKPRDIPKGEPRIAQWDSLQQRHKNVRLRFDDFEWRPYTKPLKNWNPLKTLGDDFASFARCVRVSQFVGDGFVESYYPNRVAMQFGLAQDLPEKKINHSVYTTFE